MRTLCYTVPRPKIAIQNTTDVEVSATDATIQRKVWYITDPFTTDALTNIATVHVVTQSKDQGWVSDSERGSWSWFEIAVAGPPAFSGQSAMDRIRKRDDGTLLSWFSHSNPLGGKDYTINKGKFFTQQCELWNFVQDNDSLAIIACAQYPAWKCEGKAFTLSYDEFFDPNF